MIEDRLDRIESHLAIEQLAVGYALAIDSRDLDLMATLWAPDVWMGKRWGEGRPAVQAFYAEILQGFYRSVHMIVGHRIVITGGDEATGTVYCRAEHESVDDWVVQAIVYEDSYRRVDGVWGFVKRVHHHWYSTPVTATPTGPTFEDWPGHGREGALPDLPHVWPSWEAFWTAAGASAASRFSRHPGRAL
jgi:hypothetical protein